MATVRSARKTLDRRPAGRKPRSRRRWLRRPAGLALLQLTELPPYHYGAVLPPPPGRDARSAATCAMTKAPILDNKDPAAPSVFAPAALLREARRQKRVAAADVPPLCILDPDGDIVRRLRGDGRARPFDGWPCYHTGLDTFALGGRTAGIVGCAVGAPFAVLVAEELFASGCRLLLSLTSAGQIVAAGPPPYFVVIDRALRDEGTSYHYAAASEFEPDGGLKPAGGEVAHLKVIGLGETSFAVANLVSSATPAELSLPSQGRVREVDVIVNARVAIDPAVLEGMVNQAVTAACACRGATPAFRKTQSLRPGRPTPTHRYSNAV